MYIYIYIYISYLYIHREIYLILRTYQIYGGTCLPIYSTLLKYFVRTSCLRLGRSILHLEALLDIWTSFSEARTFYVITMTSYWI